MGSRKAEKTLAQTVIRSMPVGVQGAAAGIGRQREEGMLAYKLWDRPSIVLIGLVLSHQSQVKERVLKCVTSGYQSYSGRRTEPQSLAGARFRSFFLLGADV